MRFSIRNIIVDKQRNRVPWQNYLIPQFINYSVGNCVGIAQYHLDQPE